MATTPLPEMIWVVHGFDNVLFTTILKYHVHGETLHYWKVWLRGSDYKIKKNTPGTKVFTSEDDVREFLQNVKRDQLEKAMKRVQTLSGQLSVNIQEIPPKQLKVSPGGIKL